MDDAERLTHSSRPPLPVRNPRHRYAQWNAHPMVSENLDDLVPRPLFSERAGRRPTRIYVEVQDLHSLLGPSSSQLSIPSSPTASFRSFTSYASSESSISTVSGPRSLSRTPKPQSYPFPPPDVCNWGNDGDPSPAPTPKLRRIKSPKKETLRDLRAKGSDVCLQRVYEQQLELYLQGALFPRQKWKDDLTCLDEE